MKDTEQKQPSPLAKEVAAEVMRQISFVLLGALLGLAAAWLLSGCAPPPERSPVSAHGQCQPAPPTHALICPHSGLPAVPVYRYGGVLCASSGGDIYRYPGCIVAPCSVGPCGAWDGSLVDQQAGGESEVEP